ncbi:MupA/Atu3671 family FMN-dependent luciferase-like monooxygenase [Frankia gtarii]|uniref:MupA/Atu3671 family FMN-dependent luciferase-like monooxygenase n=1 Tax=Frankia gtarii TaxID=2950102 RepID=UPI0021C0726E|nr:MupA/Atu3671 family FMN-dependent luciferase-like monooxygenase [Frankia gtarii]
MSVADLSGPDGDGSADRGERMRRRIASLSPAQRTLLERRLGRPPAARPPASRGQTGAAAGRPARRRRPASRMAFSLFFFSGDGSREDPDRYRLLLDSARYADRHGYRGIWVPERHFVDFGGLYPNPAVLAAALAMCTDRIQIRAGSVAVPLHHPARIAEEWAVVDNLSGGRVAISAASGWHPVDFVLAPGDRTAAHAERRDVLFERMEVIQRLWAGESIDFPGVTGDVAVRTLPRPVQPRLPMWVSAQGSAETFVRAGRAGANLLTGLVAQQPDELAHKIVSYRRARAEAGHDPAAGTVTAMVHTYLGPDIEEVRRVVRAPLLDYLATFLRQQDNAGGVFATLAPADRDAMLASQFDRYFDHLGLFGTPDTGEAFIEGLVDLGIDEIACLIDFGLAPELVLAGLEHLTDLLQRYRDPAGSGDD